MRAQWTTLMGLATLSSTVSALHPNITASVPLASVTASVLSGLPACATSCIKATLATSTACALSDITCICTNDAFICPTNNCEEATCTPEENEVRRNNTRVLCADFGGINRSNCSAYGASSNATISSPTPSVTPFTGDGGERLMSGWVGFVSLALGGSVLVLAAL